LFLWLRTLATREGVVKVWSLGSLVGCGLFRGFRLFSGTKRTEEQCAKTTHVA